MIPYGASSGYLRLGGNVVGKHLPVPPGVTVLAGGTLLLDDPKAPPEALAAPPRVRDIAPTELAPPRMTADQAREQGYTGDSCTTCGGSRMKMAGHCQVCESCGTSSGCS